MIDLWCRCSAVKRNLQLTADIVLLHLSISVEFAVLLLVMSTVCHDTHDRESPIPACCLLALKKLQETFFRYNRMTTCEKVALAWTLQGLRAYNFLLAKLQLLVVRMMVAKAAMAQERESGAWCCTMCLLGPNCMSGLFEGHIAASE